MSSRLCSNCGFNNPPDHRFCGHCGTRLAETGALSQAPPPAEPSPAPPTHDFSPERLGVMIGADLMERFRQAGLEAAGQRRNVTVLFTDITGYTALSAQLDAEDVYDLIQQYLRLLANNVYQYEGIVDKFTGDGLMALFGAPIAHENNAELAVRAALDMQADVRRLSQERKELLKVEVQMRVGLNAGLVVVGGVGSNLLMNYTAIGDTVNLASRLEQATLPGTVLASETVYRQTKALFDFEPTPPLTLKNVPHPVIAYRVIGPKAKPGSVRGLEGLRTPMIGREAELDKVLEAARALTERQESRFVLVTGEAGMGKSRLTAELKARLKPGTVRILEGRSFTYRRVVPYWIFLDMLRGYLGVTSEAPEAQVRERLSESVRAALGPTAAAESLPYLEHLFSLKPSDAAAAERIRYLDAGQLRQQIFLAVRDWLVAEARRLPRLLIFDDLHWADDTSLDLILFLLDALQQAPLLIYAISRPFQESSQIGHMVERAKKRLADRFTAIPLQNLSPDQSEQLLLQLLAIPDLPKSLYEQILQRAAGIPFYLEEVLRMLMDHGLLQRTDGHWALAPGATAVPLGVPETLQDLILARFDRLKPPQRRILQVASVIGRQFNLPLLEAMLPEMEAPAVQTALSRLVEREFILPQPEETQGEYAFQHVLTSDTIYSTLLKRDRAELHGQVGDALERLYAGRLEGQIELLARHYSWSLKLDRTLHYLILAGQKAARGYANEQARQHYEQALALLPQVEHLPSQALQVRLGLGEVLAFVGEYQAAREQYQTALKTMPVEDPRRYAKERSELERKTGQTFERQGDYDEALLCLAAAQSALDDVPIPMPVERAQILDDIGWIHFRRGNLEDAEQHLTRALALVEGTPQYDVMASIYNHLGGVAYQKNKLEQTSDYVRQSLALREEMGDIVGVARLYNNLGLLAYTRGDWDNALENYQKNLELQTRLGDAEALALSYLNIAILHIDLGHYAEAQTFLERGLAAAQQTGALFQVATAQMHLGRLGLKQGKFEQVSRNLEESLRLFKEIGVKENLVDVYHLMGEAQMGLERFDLAAEWARRSIDLMTELRGEAPDQSDEYGRALQLLGKAALAQGHWEAAGQYLRQSGETFQATGSRLERGKTLIELGRLSAAQGDIASARRRWQEAQQIFQGLKAQAEEQVVIELLKASPPR